MPGNEVPFWKEPWKLRAPAFQIAGPLYYVGNRNVSSHLIKGASSAVLIDTAFAQTTYLLTESIRSVGVDPKEIELILHTHGHVDHCGATRRLKELTGAKVALGAPDVEAVERGTRYTCAEHLYGIADFETFKVDRPLKHLDSMDVGETTILCHRTPGHTPGVITYIFDVEAEGKKLTAGLFGGPGLWTMRDEHRREQGYPENRDDFAKSLEYLKTLEVDIWLGAHPGQNNTFEKYERLKGGEGPNPFIDPAGWKGFIDRIEADFRKMCGG